MRNEITLRHADRCRADAWDSLKHFDKFYYLTGKVLESKYTAVKIQFDCDEKQGKNSALIFDPKKTEFNAAEKL